MPAPLKAEGKKGRATVFRLFALLLLVRPACQMFDPTAVASGFSSVCVCLCSAHRAALLPTEGKGKRKGESALIPLAPPVLSHNDGDDDRVCLRARNLQSASQSVRRSARVELTRERINSEPAARPIGICSSDVIAKCTSFKIAAASSIRTESFPLSFAITNANQNQ